LLNFLPFLLGNVSSVFLFVLKEISQYSDMENKIRTLKELPTDKTTSISISVSTKVYLYTTILEIHPVKQVIVSINSPFKGWRKIG